MDQYPDENEEFELLYQQELDMLDELPPDEDENYLPIPAAEPCTSRSVQIQSDKSESLSSPAFSQISYGYNDTAIGGPVSRRLFGTPVGPQKRGTSTPLTNKHLLAPIEEVVDITSDIPLAPLANTELQGIGLRSKRRLERDLFGDIDDLYNNESYEDPLAKKARTDEERDLEMISKILETRRQLRDANKHLHKDDFSQLKALHAFKMQNLSYTVPKWPFLPLQRSDSQRVYVRFHSDDFEQRALDSVSAVPNYSGLLGENKRQVWEGANEIVLRRTSSNITQAEADTSTEGATTAVAIRPAGNERLWVEKYKPRKYVDLLSDEMTNRSLLYWLKMWDKVVFGKEFKIKDNSKKDGELSTFNKRTGKFESTGGWKNRKTKQTLNTNIDELGRPIQKVALLCGPPGLGKTTLAHTIARHAGYAVREVNASDDRSPEAFKLALENGTQMSSVMNQDRRPNCIILDEIDGAPRQSIEFLVKFVSDNVLNKAGTKGKGKTQRNILKRPIICICNDVYDPALRPLRLVAFVVTFPPIDASRLTERLVQIATRERLKSDFGTLYALAEKSGNDVRSCVSTMQFFNGQKKVLTLHDVLNNNLGQKDRHQGLFEIWNSIFRVQRPRKKLLAQGIDNDGPQVTMTDMSVHTRSQNVLDVVHSAGDYEKLMQGVYENYLTQKMPDSNLNGVVQGMQWFCFNDMVQNHINQRQNYSVYPYLQFGFVVWHLLFASLAWPKITFPTRGFEFRQKGVTQRNIFQSLRKGISSGAVGVGQGSAILVDTVPLLKRILSPQLRSVAVQLLSTKEKYDLRHTVEVMVDLGITYTQVKSADGAYVFQMEPDLDLLGQFPGYSGVTLAYFSRQLIAREVELERIRLSTPKLSGTVNKKPVSLATKNVPNHLQTLMPKKIDKNANSTTARKDVVSKDFFGRIQCRMTSTQEHEQSKSDPIVKSPIWYRYKEGFNNAVRKDIHINELL